MLVYHFFTEKLVRQRFVQFGNFGLPFKTFRVFRKFSVWSSQNCLTIYFLTEISEHFWVNGKQIMYSMVLKKYKKSLQVKMVFYLVSLPQLPVETRFQCLWPSSLRVKCIREWIRVTHKNKNKQTNKQTQNALKPRVYRSGHWSEVLVKELNYARSKQKMLYVYSFKDTKSRTCLSNSYRNNLFINGIPMSGTTSWVSKPQ